MTKINAHLLSPAVTVVIPCFQQQAYLERALLSVKSQTCQNIEVIVVDDGSEPALSIPAGYDSARLIRQNNSGLSSARNTGLAAANGEFIKFLDADDELRPGCIERQLLSFGCAEKTISCTGFTEICEQTGRTGDILPAFGEPLSAIALINFGPPHIYLFRTAEIREAGAFSVSDRVRGGHEDYDLIFRLLVSGFRVRTLHSALAVYHKRENSMSSKRGPMNRTRSLVWLHNTLEAFEKGRMAEQEILLSFTTGLALILKTTPEDCKHLYEPLIDLFESSLREQVLTINKDDLSRLTSLLLENEQTVRLAGGLSVSQFAGLEQQAFPARFIIDPRFHLKTKERHFPDTTLARVLGRTLKHNHHFAIYGAAESGRRLLKILSAAGIRPAFIVDRAWQNIEAIDGIPVRAPDSLSESDIQLVVIASSGSYNEISRSIEEMASELEIV
ncbi:glycosyltransferase [Alteromonas sp. NFXS44]|uniref:glycosyltransferase family 2 protein n=1 Tax=Alteromonas sp. NFXS44 TaxID=2818435 RepID=UPI0032E01B92